MPPPLQRGRRFYAAHLERQKADIESQVSTHLSARTVCETGFLACQHMPCLPSGGQAKCCEILMPSPQREAEVFTIPFVCLVLLPTLSMLPCPTCHQVRREMAAELGPDGAAAIADLQLPAFDGNVITPGEASSWAVDSWLSNVNVCC